MDDKELNKRLQSATSLLPVENPAPTHNEEGEEDWEPEIKRLEQLNRQKEQKVQAVKRVKELYYDVHTSTRMTQRNKYKMWYIKKFLHSPLLQTIPEK